MTHHQEIQLPTTLAEVLDVLNVKSRPRQETSTVQVVRDLARQHIREPSSVGHSDRHPATAQTAGIVASRRLRGEAQHPQHHQKRSGQCLACGWGVAGF